MGCNLNYRKKGNVHNASLQIELSLVRSFHLMADYRDQLIKTRDRIFLPRIERSTPYHLFKISRVSKTHVTQHFNIRRKRKNIINSRILSFSIIPFFLINLTFFFPPFFLSKM